MLDFPAPEGAEMTKQIPRDEKGKAFCGATKDIYNSLIYQLIFLYIRKKADDEYETEFNINYRRFIWHRKSLCASHRQTR